MATNDVKIPVSASVSGVTKELDKIPKLVEDVTRKLDKLKWNPVDLKVFAGDLKKIEQLILDFQKRVGPLATGGAGGSGTGGGGGGGSGPNAMPSLNLPPPGAGHGPGAAVGRGGRGSRTYAPDAYDIGRSAIGGFGGGFSQVSGYAIRGAMAGGYAGGASGAGIGLLRGGAIGAAAYGAYKIGAAVTDGYEMSKERAGTLDALKRQMGDVGISFERLKEVAEESAKGLGLNSVEAAKMAQEFNRLSRGAEKTPGGLTDGTRVGLGLSKAYGLDGSAGIGFVGGMRNIDPRQGNRELAMLLADAIEQSGMNARADEVMQHMQSFAESSARMSLSAPNLGAYASAYGSMLSSRSAGLTPEAAAGILGQANSTIQRMGGAGEAGQNFIMEALSRKGDLNPISATALAEGGIFGTRSSVFGAGTPLAGYMGGLGGLGQGDATNFDEIRAKLDAMPGNKWLKLDAAKRLFGTSSLSSAAALMSLDTGGAGRLGKFVGRAGIDINSVNETGLATMAKIAGSTKHDQLADVYRTMAARTGKDALTTKQRENLQRLASGNNTEAFRDELMRAAAANGQESTTFTEMRDQLKTLDDIKINTGDRLLDPINEIRGFLSAIAGVLAPDSASVRSQKKLADDLAKPMAATRESLQNQLNGTLSVTSSWFQNQTPQKQDEIRAKRKRAQQNLESINFLDAQEKANGLPSGTLMGIWGTESGFGRNTGVSSAGARGHFQFMPRTAEQYGVKIGDFESEAAGAGRYMGDLLKKRGGNLSRALMDYNGVVHNVAAGEDYVRKVQAYGNMGAETPLPDNAKRALTTGDFTRMDRAYEADLILHPRDAQMRSLGQPVKTRIGVPRSEGTR